MFTGIRIFSSDAIWRQILGDLNAIIVDDADAGAVDFDALRISMPVCLDDLRVAIFGALDNSELISDIVGKNVNLSPLQGQIITLLHKSGGMSVVDMKHALGYAPDATTHAVDTAIYGLRKMCGHDIIQNIGGIYKLGRI